VLHAVMEDLSTDLTEAESKSLESLESFKPEWQRNVAQRMAGSSRNRVAYMRTWLARAAAVLVAAGGGWLAWNQWMASDPARLIASAYTQQRPFEYRIPGAGQAEVRVMRGAGSSFKRPPALLEAEAKIARELEKSPESVKWLALRGRAELLAWDSEAAIATLQRALEQKPDDPDLLADLGIAFALRAETRSKDVDYSNAIEYLGRSLKAKPDSPEAVFNRAVVFEKFGLRDEAEGEWRRYLEMDKSGAWRDEAQRRLAELEQKKKARAQTLDLISGDPELLLRSIERGEDVEPEIYLDVAVTKWLPSRWEDAKFERSLIALAIRFEERHRDRWLRDVLASRRSQRAEQGLAALSAAVEANLADEPDRGLANATDAVSRLKAAGDEAGALRGELEQTYALERALRGAECLEKTAALERKATAMSYSWILGQTLVEQGTCRGQKGDSGGAHRDMERAVAHLREAKYEDLELRAAGILSGSQTVAGNALASWSLARAELATYWGGPHPGIRAHQIYFNLFRSAESLGQPHTAYVFGKAAAQAIANTPRHRTEALTRTRVAGLAAQAGWVEEAHAEFERATTLFDQLDQTAADLEYRARAELDRAEAEVVAGSPRSALDRLEALRSSTVNMGSAVIRIRFQEILGEVMWHNRRLQEAGSAHRQAIELSEQRLKTLPSPRERAALMQTADKAYRGLVELYFGKGDYAGALRVWEWFRAGEAPGRRVEPDLDRRLPKLQNESFLSYAALPGGLVAWVYDDHGVQGLRLAVKPADLGPVSWRFLRQCADPASSPLAIRRDARQLYAWLVAPLEGRLDPARTLVVEPDGAIGSLPMQALVDPNSRYLGERFAITVASGLDDYQRRSEAGPVTAAGKAVVVADPVLGKEKSLAFPPLAQTMREGQAIAARFQRFALLTRKGATLAALERQRPDTELLHFAGHGFSNAGNGGLLLAPEGSDDPEAGVLDGKRIASQDWSRCRLAVLSACSTGTGENRGAVNPESLVRGMLWAGTARVVATRWNVDAESSVAFMDRFYDALLSGACVATSLQHAGQVLRENERTSHPYFWAGFQSFGAR
jgi:CHAT domain-containing protein/tetratricopeptide (TPR) repeat protein